ncbi:MAG: ABC transporter permease subunit [Planctomycetota bacterium]
MKQFAPIAHLTLRECLRRAFPYVAVVALVLLVATSRLFLHFTFGQQRAESLNLAISGAFLAGFALALFVGTGLVRRDLERQTLPWLLTKPLGLASYVLGRLLGLVAAAALLALLVTAGSAPILAGMSDQVSWIDVLAAGARALAPLLVLCAAALAASALAGRALAPLLLLALFLLGSLFPQSLLVPDFSLFSLDANATAPSALAWLYALVFCSIFALFAYIVLAIRIPGTREG